MATKWIALFVLLYIALQFYVKPWLIKGNAQKAAKAKPATPHSGDAHATEDGHDTHHTEEKVGAGTQILHWFIKVLIGVPLGAAVIAGIFILVMWGLGWCFGKLGDAISIGHRNQTVIHVVPKVPVVHGDRVTTLTLEPNMESKRVYVLSCEQVTGVSLDDTVTFTAYYPDGSGPETHTVWPGHLEPVRREDNMYFVYICPKKTTVTITKTFYDQ